MLQENFGSKFDTCCIFKPNASAKVAAELWTHGKALTKQGHAVIVGGRGRVWINVIVI
jgi:hypothetical protein